MKTILITGGAGFIGSHIAEQMQGRAHVRVLDNFRTGYRRNLDGLDIELIEGSVLDRGVLSRAMKGVDYVYHLAALVSVPESVAKPRECVELNVVGTLNVLDAASEAEVQKLFFASSAAVYGNNPSVPKHELMMPEPCSPYAVSKLDGEYYCQQYAADGRLNTVALRFFNVFGPRQDPQSAYAAAIPIFIKQAINDDTITIYGDGEQTRDFIYVKDLVAACIFVTETASVSGVFNAGYGEQITINRLAERIIALAASESQIRHQESRPGDIRHSLANVNALKKVGFCRPWIGMERGLQETLSFFREKN